MNYAAARGEELDYRGHRPAVWSLHPGWIVLTILGFIFWWPVGLAILAFTLWNKKIGCWGGHSYEGWQDKMERVRAKVERFGQGDWAKPSSGNRAFDDYRTETYRWQPGGDSLSSQLSTGDWVTTHWGWACERLSSLQVAALAHFTLRQLDATNSTVDELT